MINSIIGRMTDEQKQMVVDAPRKSIIIVTEGNGKGLFRALLNVQKKANVSVTVARTELEFNDDADASDVIEGVINTILDSAPEKKSEPAPKPKPKAKEKKKASSKKKSGSPRKKVDGWKFYQDAKKEWRWRHTDKNGKIIGAATEGYVNHADCKKNASRNGWIGNADSKKE